MASQLHFLLFPYMAQGHLIPMVDFGRLLARRGVMVTIVTTPLNAARFKAIIDRDRISAGLQICFAELEFPSKAAGLPEGIENQDQLPPSISDIQFIVAARFLQAPLEKLFETLQPRPNCIVSDYALPFTMNVARKFDVPRLCFYVFNCFTCVLIHLAYPLLVKAKTDDECFVVPGISDRIEISNRHLPVSSSRNGVDDYQLEMYRAEMSSYGYVVNTFEEMESEYVKAFAKKRNRTWCVGPLSLCNKDAMDIAQRGKKAAVDEDVCLKWLDSQEPSSVLYISFGSLFNPIPIQLIELAMALESSGKPFIWTIKGGDESSELKKWVAENEYEKKVEGKGLLIWGWAPQVMILSHSSVGGFLTHSGSNSLLEGICMGVPLLSWPLMYDQFLSEKLVVDVLKIAVSVGEIYPLNTEKGQSGVQVKKEEIMAAIDKLMDEGEESKERRRRVKELAEKAKTAVVDGGSSHLNLSMLIKDVAGYSQVLSDN